MSDPQVVFEDPPPRPGSLNTRNAQWPDRLAPLLKKRGQWARVWDTPTRAQANYTATALRTGRYKRPPGQWEFTVRTVENHYFVYARYLGTGNGAS